MVFDLAGTRGLPEGQRTLAGGDADQVHVPIIGPVPRQMSVTREPANHSEVFDRLAQAVGLAKGPEFLGWLAHLKAELKIPATLKDAGVAADKLDALVRVAVADGCHPSNPVAVSEKDFSDIFRRDKFYEFSFAYNRFARQPQPVQFGIVDAEQNPFGIKRMVAAKRIIIKILQFSRPFLNFCFQFQIQLP